MIWRAAAAGRTPQLAGEDSPRCGGLVVQSGAMSYGYVPPPPGVAPQPGYPPPGVRRSGKKLAWIIAGAIVGLVLIILLFIAGLVTLVFGSMKSSDPYRHAVQVATHDPRVIAALGAPVNTGWLISGSVNISNDSGNADLAIPLSGSMHKGTIHVVAKKSDGVWSYENLSVRIPETEERIDLLSPQH